MAFKKAEKKQAKLRLALYGPSGSGKTYTALALATELRKALGLAGRIAVIDSERGSASKYADLFDFDADELTSFAPDAYRKSIREATAGGYSVLVIDSLSHAWVGEGGVLDMVDDEATKLRGNSHAAWKKGTPEYRGLVDAILQSPIHVIATMRSKTEWDMNAVDERTGKKQPKKVGAAPVMRDGIEYEFDVTASMDVDHNLVVDKTRCAALDGKVFRKPSDEPARTLAAWLTSGAAVVEKPAAQSSGAKPVAVEDEADVEHGDNVAAIVAAYDDCASADLFPGLKARRTAVWAHLSADQREAISAAARRAGERLGLVATKPGAAA